MGHFIGVIGLLVVIANRVGQFTLMSKINWAWCVFSLVRSLGPPKKNLGSFRAFFTVAQEIEYFQFSKGGPLVTQKKITANIGNMGIKSCVWA